MVTVVTALLQHAHFLLFQKVNWVKNVILFGVDNSSSVYADKRKKDIIFLDEGQQMD